MFSGLVSASYWYVDVAIAVFLALFLIGGIIKGFAKSTKGFFAFVVVVCASALLMGVTQESAMESSIGTGIEDKISSAAGDWGVAFNSPVQRDADGNIYVLVNDSPVLLDAQEFGFKGTMAKFYAERFDVADGDTVAGSAVRSLTGVCVSAVMFLIFVAAFLVLFLVLRILPSPVSNSDPTAVKAVDKTIGAILRLFIGLVIVWAIIPIVAAIGEKAGVVDEYIHGSAIGGFFYENNPLTTVFKMIFGG